MLQKCVSTPYKLTLGLLAALEITKIGILTLPWIIKWEEKPKDRAANK